jgi:large subunit ribosomal protein L9
VGAGDIAAAAKDAGIDIEKHQVRLTGGPLRAVGEYEVTIHLHAEVQGTLKVAIVPEP